MAQKKCEGCNAFEDYEFSCLWNNTWKIKGHFICFKCVKEGIDQCQIYIDGEHGGRRDCNTFTKLRKPYNLNGSDCKLWLCPDHEFHYEKLHNKCNDNKLNL